MVERTESGKGNPKGFPWNGCLATKEKDENELFTPLITPATKSKKKSGLELSLIFFALQ